MKYNLSIPCLDMDCKEYSRHVDIVVDKLGYDNICKYIQDHYYQFKSNKEIPDRLKNDPWYCSLVTTDPNKEYQDKLQDIHLTLKRLSKKEQDQLNNLGIIKIGIRECDFEYTKKFYDTYIDITREILSEEDFKEMIKEENECYEWRDPDGIHLLKKIVNIESHDDALSFLDKNNKTLFSIYKVTFDKMKDTFK